MAGSYSVRTILDKRRKLNDGTYPLKNRIIVDGDYFDVPLKYSIPEKYWLSSQSAVSKEYGEILKTNADHKQIGDLKRFNNYLLKKRSEILNALQQLQDDGILETLSLKEIKERINPKNKKLKVLGLAKERIDELKASKHFGNARVYETMMRSLETFLKGVDIVFARINYEFLKNYETWYLSRDNNSYNGLAVNLRTLRALFNHTIKKKLISKDLYPFTEYKIKEEDTRKRAITLEALTQFLDYEPESQALITAQNLFKISFMLMGASFVDLAFLKLKNIRHGRIEFKRRKTGALYSIVVFPQLDEILATYMKGKGVEDYIFDIVRSQDPEKQLAEIKNKLKKYNEALKEVAKLSGISGEDMTSYVSRHTYATVSKKLGVPTSVIKEELGHTTEETTQIYLDSFGNEVIDEYHGIVIEKLSNKPEAHS